MVFSKAAPLACMHFFFKKKKDLPKQLLFISYHEIMTLMSWRG